MLVTTNGGVHHSNGSLCTLLGTNSLLKVYPIVSISTDIDELKKLAQGKSSSLAGKQRDPERDSAVLPEM